MKSFGGFLKSIQGICNSNGITTSTVYSQKKIHYLESFNSNDTCIIVAHGSPDSIYHRFDHNYHRHQILIDLNNLNNLNGGKIIAISCACARKLGPESVTSGNCKVFLGFMNAIHFDKKDKNKRVCKYYEQYIKEIYKAVFYKVLTSAVLGNWTFEKLADRLEWELKREAMINAKAEREKNERAYIGRGINETIVAVTDVASSIRVFGDGSQTIS